jgi:hypothetical protein
VRSFFDIELPSVNFRKYIAEKVKDDFSKKLYEQWLSWLPQGVKNVNQSYGTSISEPEIQIKDSEVINAEAIYGLIYISSGMLEFIRDIKFCNIGMLRNDIQLSSYQCDHYVLYGSYLWLIYHELFHIAFGHDEIISAQENKKLASMACELDADLCAIAMIYRTIQKALSQSDLGKKQLCCLVLYSVFWFIRQIQPLGHESDHPSIEKRLYFLIYKIATLREKSGSENADLGLEDSDSQQALVEMIEMVRKMDKALLGINVSGDSIEAITKEAKSFITDTSLGCEWNRLFRESRLSTN